MTTLSEACDQLGDSRTAAILYERLRPIADQNHIVANLLVCSGSLHYHCGMLAGCLRRREETEHHFESGVAP